ncbi:MAG: DUF371 domain-containing protein [Methanolinea sp.]|jgi:hypothetical protein|nr:DUF371 domain-containing protein [Methanolinea sp.]
MPGVARVTIRCKGHPFVTALHPTTLEITRDTELTPRGDCIIGIAADMAARDLPREVRELLCRDDAVVTAGFCCEGQVVTVRGRGSSRMTLSHPDDMVFRRSGFVCDRTVAICADGAARTFPRDFVAQVAAGKPVIVTFEVSVP